MRINQRLLSSVDNVNYLIVDFCEPLDKIAVIDLSDSVPKRPFLLRLSNVTSSIKNEKWRLADNEFDNVLFDSDDNIQKSSHRLKWLVKRDVAYSVIAPIVDNEENRFNYLFSNSEGLLADLIDKSGRSKSYVSKMLNRFWRFGSHKNALLPLWRKCGNNSTIPKSPKITTLGEVNLVSKHGPKTKYGASYRGVTERDVTNIKAFAKKIPSGAKVKLSHLYEDFCRTYLYSTVKPKFDDAEALSIPLPRRHLISPTSFKYHLKKHVSKLEFIRKEVGYINFQKDKAGKPGLARHSVRGPTSRYEIDATIADVYILNPYDATNQTATGRPVIYSVVDTWSGMIVGLHACFHGPDWTGASQALFNAFTDKVKFCKKYGVDIRTEDWPSHHVCSQLVMDRGSEYTDANIEGLLMGKIGITTGSFVAYHRGDFKGTVEQMFRVIQDNTLSFVAGQVVKIPQKESQHASRTVAMSFDDFMKRIIEISIYTNNNRIRKENHNFEMSRDDVGLTPRDLYCWGLKEISIRPVASSEADIRFALLPTAKATVRSEGVYCNGLYYSSNEIIKKQWLDRAKSMGRFYVDVRYDSNSTNHIWCRDEETNEVLQLDITDRSEAYQNQNWADVMHQVELFKSKVSIHDEKAFANKVEFREKLAQMDKETQKKTKYLKKSYAKTIQSGMKDTAQTEAVLAKYKLSEEISETLSPRATHKPKSSQTLDTPNFFDFEDE
jgi:putative transposase